MEFDRNILVADLDKKLTHKLQSLWKVVSVITSVSSSRDVSRLEWLCEGTAIKVCGINHLAVKNYTKKTLIFT